MLSLTELSWYDKNGKLQNILDFVYPVGSIYMTTNGQNPSTLFGGEWVAWGQGRVPVGVGTGEDINGVSKTFGSDVTGGEYNHTLSDAEMPRHDHAGTLVEYDDVLEQSSEPGAEEVNTYMVSKNNNIYTAVGKIHREYFENKANTNKFVVDTSQSGESFMSKTGGSNRQVHFKVEGIVPEDGSGESHNNIQPYITCYMWKRTA